MIFMKRIATSIAVLGLSTCLLAGSAIPAFATAPAAAVTGHQASTCHNETNPDAVIVAQFPQADGTTVTHTLCAYGGEVDGKAALTRVSGVFANFSNPYVYTGTLPEGQQVMTVSCMGGNGARKYITADLQLPHELVAGQDLHLVQADGSSVKLSIDRSGTWAKVSVPMQDGAALLLMVPQANS